MRFLSRLYFCSAPRPPPKPSQTSARIPPTPAPAAPLLYPFQPGAAFAPPWPLLLQQALLPLLTPWPRFRHSLPSRSLAPANHFPSQPSISRPSHPPPAPALHSCPGPALPPRPLAPAPALHFRLGHLLPPQPPHSRPSYPPPLYLYIPPQMFHVEHLGSLFVPKKLRTFFCVCWHEIQLTGEECSTWNILPL